MKDVRVIKRDGTTEKFNPDKIHRVMRAAGMNEEQTKLLIASIVSWITTLNIESIDSVKLRDAILDEMKKLNKPAAGLFEWYHQIKEKKE